MSELLRRRDMHRLKWALDREARLKEAPGLKQFTLPAEQPIRNIKADPTSNQAIGRAHRERR